MNITCAECGVDFCWLGVWIKGKPIRRGKTPKFCSDSCNCRCKARRFRYKNPWQDQTEEWKEQSRERVRRHLHTEHGRAKAYARIDDRQRWEGCGLAALSSEEKRQTYAVYEECARLNSIHGAGAYHVDHILPRAKGGDHAWWNLQILTEAENLSKSDRFRPEDEALYVTRINQLFNQHV